MKKVRTMNLKKFAPYAFTIVLLTAQSSLFAQDMGSSSAVVSDSVLLWSLIGVAVVLVLVNFVLMGTIKSVAADRKIWDVVREKMEKTSGGAAVLALLLSLTGLTANAQAEAAAAAPEFVMGSDLFYALLAMNAILLGLVFYQISVLRSIVQLMKGPEEEVETVIDSWTAALTDVVAIEDEESIMMEHEHDGIRELDNNLPPWWLYGFYFTIVFGVFYIIHFHITPLPGLDKVPIIGAGVDQETAYEMEMAIAEAEVAEYRSKMANLIDETNVELSTEEGVLAEGQAIFVGKCAACHKADGGGNVGPNLTDQYWKHGGGISNIFATIKYGVPEAGMIAWGEGELTPGEMRSVASYIISLEGSNPPDAKEAEGELWTPPVEEAAPADSAAAAPEPEMTAEPVEDEAGQTTE